jgi:RNA polymerase-binding transcription factor DksA
MEPEDIGPAGEPGLADHEGHLAVLEQVEVELADVEHALRRLDEGTYGVCEACGSAIGAERLAAFPAARLCAADDSPVALRFF